MAGASSAFSNLPLRDKGLVVVSVPVVALLIVLAGMVFVQREEQQAERLLQHTMDVRQNLQLALTLLIDAETGTRGYLLTNRDEWLAPYRNALQQIPSVIDRLEKLVVLQDANNKRSLAEMQGALALSKDSMDQAREIFAQMQSDEEEILA